MSISILPAVEIKFAVPETMSGSLSTVPCIILELAVRETVPCEPASIRPTVKRPPTVIVITPLVERRSPRSVPASRSSVSVIVRGAFSSETTPRTVCAFDRIVAPENADNTILLVVIRPTAARFVAVIFPDSARSVTVRGAVIAASTMRSPPRAASVISSVRVEFESPAVIAPVRVSFCAVTKIEPLRVDAPSRMRSPDCRSMIRSPSPVRKMAALENVLKIASSGCSRAVQRKRPAEI